MERNALKISQNSDLSVIVSFLLLLLLIASFIDSRYSWEAQQQDRPYFSITDKNIC